MKPTATLAILSAVFLTDCDRTSKTTTSSGTVASDAAAKEIPLLPIKKGDTWNYDVHLEIPAGMNGQVELRKTTWSSPAETPT